MTVEEIKEVAASETQEQTQETQQEEVTSVGNVNKDTETIGVDLWGISVDLPVSKAKEVIEKRQSQSKGYKELKDKVETYEREKAQLARKLEAVELAKKGQHEEAEQIFNEKLSAEVSRYKDKIIDGELKSELMSAENFLGKEALDDALLLLKASNKFELNDSNELVSGEANIKDVVKSFIESKPVFQRAAKSNSNSARPAAVVADNRESSRDRLGKGLSKLIG